MNTKSTAHLAIVPIKVLADAVRAEVRKMSDQELVRRVVESGMLGGSPAPGLAKRVATEEAVEIETAIIEALRSFGDAGASSTEIAARLGQYNPEKVVEACKRLAARTDGAPKIYRAGEHKYTRYGLSKAIARSASRRARGAA